MHVKNRNCLDDVLVQSVNEPDDVTGHLLRVFRWLFEIATGRDLHCIVSAGTPLRTKDEFRPFMSSACALASLSA